jgi:hypothetical protein
VPRRAQNLPVVVLLTDGLQTDAPEEELRSAEEVDVRPSPATPRRSGDRPLAT